MLPRADVVPPPSQQHYSQSSGIVRPSPLSAHLDHLNGVGPGLLRQQHTSLPTHAAGGPGGFQFQPPPHAHMERPQRMFASPAAGNPPIPQPPDLLQLIHHAPHNLDILQRPEAFNLQRALESGDATPGTLLQQFAHGNLPPLQREILLNVLKVLQNRGTLPTRFPGGGMHPPPLGISPRTSPLPDTLSLNILQQRQQQHHHRVSPSVFVQHQAQQQPLKSNNLAVSPTGGNQQRIPSPQELVHHAQQIMQNALIKRKLEEQKENFRRRQEGAAAAAAAAAEVASSSGPDPSPNLHFTPTVVMKKLAAERRDSDPQRPPQIPDLRVDVGGENEGGKAMMMPPVPLPPPQPQQQQQQQAFQMAQQPQQQGTPGGLSRFFSAEVLAQAQSGNTPNMPPLPTQKALTLEEIERQAAAVRI